MDLYRVLFTLFLLDHLIDKSVSEKLYNGVDHEQVVFDGQKQFSTKRNQIRHVLREEGTGEDDKKSLDSSDLIDDGSIITEPDEETFNSGIHSINQLSKDEKEDAKINNRGKNKKKHGDKKLKQGNTTLKKNETTIGIDLKYLQDLFQSKNIDDFQKNFTENLKKKALNNLYRELVANKKKVLASFGNHTRISSKLDNDDDILRKLVEEERNSERYQIDFPLFYHATGTITLPYDDLVEPFEAWYAGELNMSRIDYYQGNCV